jgi:RNA polymerase sigma factor (sigma-70 family)
MLQQIISPATIFIDFIGGEKLGLNKHLQNSRSKGPVELSDEELCRSTQQGCAASRNFLWIRYSDYIQRIVHKENKRQNLPRHEIADALQELYFAFHAAVLRYDPENHCHERLASFKTFLTIIVVRAFSKYCNRWRKYRDCVVPDLDGKALHSLAGGAEEVSHVLLDANDRNGRSSTGCELILLTDLNSDRLAEALRGLKPKERLLIEIWLQCRRDKEVAQVLKISPAAARLRRERLFRRIKQSSTSK